MERTITQRLLEWKSSPWRKPLILMGARQVGKTYSLKEFGKKYYEHLAYINCDDDDRVRDLFVANYDMQRILLTIGALTGVPIIPGKTLIFLDEIQALPRGLGSLKYFNENAPQYHVAVAGSLLGIALNPGESFPVGKVDMLRMFPMTFNEFLLSKGNRPLHDALVSCDWLTINALRPMLNNILREYYFVGGMPEVVSLFLKSNDAVTVRRAQQNILEAYERDMSKHAPTDQVPRIHQVWNSMPSQLAKENKKFIYGVIKSGGRAKEFELAIQWLVDAGLVFKVPRISTPKLSLKFYEDISSFKLFVLDCGLYGALAQTPPEQLLMPNAMEESKGAFTENYVASQLHAIDSVYTYYYSKLNSPMEIDFVVQCGSRIIPIEVKSEENLKSKSLKLFVEEHELYGLRMSMSEYNKHDWMENIPLFACQAYMQRLVKDEQSKMNCT